MPWRTLIVALALVATLTGCGSRAREAAWLLGDVAAAGGPSALKQRTLAPQRESVGYRVGDRERTGDLYLSPDGAIAGLVLVPGAARGGKDDPRLVALATSLARVRFAVLIPEMANFRELTVRPGDIGEIADALRWLGGAGHYPAGAPLGIAAISYAVGPALLATLEDDINPAVGFVVAVGGYHDMRQVITFFTTGDFQADGVWRHLEPNSYGKWVFVHSNTERIANQDDRRLLTEIARRKLDDLDADIEDLAARLGVEGRAVHELVSNRQRARVGALIAALPAAMQADIAALDPAGRDLAKLKARAILIHGRGDPIIPYSESQALLRALAPDQGDLFLLDGLWHVDLDLSLLDRLRLWCAADALLAARDAD